MLRKFGIWAMVLFACLVTAGPASAADTSFYQGKTLTIIVPYSTGGGHDALARLVAPYMKKSLGVARVKVVNKPGGGGLIGDNAVYNSSPDGLTIGLISTSGVLDQILNEDGREFNMSHYTILGAPDFSPHVLIAQPDGPYKSFDDLLGVKKPLTVLADGKGGLEYVLSQVVFNIFNIPHQIVAAYKGEHNVQGAFATGQGDLTFLAIAHVVELGNSNRPLMLVSDEDYSGLPNVPTVMQLAKQHGVSEKNLDMLKTLSQAMFTAMLAVGPPGIPADRAQALRKAFKQAAQNPDYQAQARKIHDVPQYTSGRQMKDAIEALLKYGDEIRQLTEQKD